MVWTLADRDGAGRRVVMPAGDDPFWKIGDDGAIIEEDTYVILRRKQSTNVALQYEVRSVGTLDGLGDLRVGSMD